MDTAEDVLTGVCVFLTVSVCVFLRARVTWGALRKLWLKPNLGQVLHGLPTGIQIGEAKPFRPSAPFVCRKHY